MINTSKKKITRVVTCQGGIQLVAALAAMASREQEQKNSGSEVQYDDFLVIYDLYAPHGQVDPFASFIKKMAAMVGNWKAVIYIAHEEIEQFAVNLETSRASTVFAQVRELMGVAKADEIYMRANWQFGNRLMMNAYLDAEKICYGDAIGIYFSEAYFFPEPKTNEVNFQSLIRQNVTRLKNSLRYRLGPAIEAPEAPPNHALRSTILKEQDFDIGYFLLPNILGEQPPMETRLVQKESTMEIFRQLARQLADSDVEKYRYLSRVPTVVLMTSNFSEAARMSGKNEIAAYKEFLIRRRFPRESTLVIKPHPRDGEEKIKKLGDALSELFSEVVLLKDPNLFFLPFEIFLMQVYANQFSESTSNLKIITFSTACLSLEVLFNLGPIIGFGDDLVEKFFNQDYVRGRIRHEHDLQLALEELAQVA